MHEQPRPLDSQYETDYATAIIGADVLFGGNVGSDSGKDHFIADHWPSELALPEVYSDPIAQEIIKAGGVSRENEAQVKLLMEKYGLEGLPDKVIAAESSGDTDRRTFVTGTMTSIRLMVQTARAIAEGVELPAFEERYTSVTAGVAPRVLPIDEALEELTDSLVAIGKNPKDKKDALRIAREWEEKRYIKPGDFADVARGNIAKQLAEMRRRIMANIDFNIPGHDPHLDDVAFDGMRFNTVTGAHFTGSLTYTGGTGENGEPLLGCNYEYNTDHPLTIDNMWHLAGHEGIPGHYMQMAIMDLQRRSGKFGIEGAISPMCTGETTLMEGWAQAVPELLLGKSRAFGPNYRVHTALERLQDMAKNNAGVMHHEGVSIEELGRIFSEEYGLSPAIVKKMTGAWAKDPIISSMYSPAYWVGGEAVRTAIQKYGPVETAKVALHTEGLADQNVFNIKMARKTPLAA